MARIAILGGGLAGWALALAAARAGHTAVLAERRTDAACELTATSHSWLKNGKSGLEIPAPVGAMKKYFMQSLLDEGVEPLLMDAPAGVAMKDGHAAGAVLAGKFGVHYAAADCVIDATAQAVSCGAESGGEVTAAFTFECGHMPALYEAALETPASLNLEGDRVVLHPSLIPDVTAVEFRLRVPAAASPIERSRQELAAREKAVAVFQALRQRAGLESIEMRSAAPEMAVPVCAAPKETPAGVKRFAWTGGLDVSTRDIEALRRKAETFIADLGDLEEIHAEPDELLLSGHSVRAFSLGAAGVLPQGLRPVYIDWARSGLPVLDADAIVAGAGTSGMPAAIALLEERVKTAVIEPYYQPGGTRTLGRVHGHYYGNRAGMDRRLNDEVAALSDTLREKGALTDGNARELLYERYLEDEHCLPLLGSMVCGAWTEDGAFCGAAIASDWGLSLVRARVIVDTTSDADAAVFAGAKYDFGCPRDGSVMTNGQWGDSAGVLSDFTYSCWKRDFDMIDNDDYADLLRAQYAAHARNSDVDFSPINTMRESRRIHGLYTLTLSDVLLEKSFDDTVALGYTPYDTHGRGSSALVVMGLVHNGAQPLTARIPYRCFLPEGLEGVLAGGKSLSATRDASSLCRMNADVENAGYALGLAAAMAVRGRCLPAQIDVKALRERLIQAGCLTEAEPARSITAAMAAREMEAGDEDALAHCVVQDASEMLPLLRAMDTPAFTGDSDALDMALCRFGDERGVDGVLRLMRETGDLDDWSKLRSSTGYGLKHTSFSDETAPYHRLNRLITLLGMSGDRRALPTLIELTQRAHSGGAPVEGERPYHKNRLDTRRVPGFERIAALSFALEHLSDASAADALEKLLEKPYVGGYLLHAEHDTPDFPMSGWLEIAVSRALARCGGRAGYERLAEYASDARAVLSRHARSELSELTGCDYGADTAAWKKWIAAQEVLPVKPYEKIWID